MKRTFLVLALALLGAFAFSQEKIAVFPFEDMDNLLTKNESVFFYRQFSNEFTNKNAGRFTIVPRQDVEKLFNAEEKFQLSDLSAKAKTAETQRVLNGTQILSGVIGKVGNRITISVSLYTFPEFGQLPGGVDLRVANKDELFDKIPELVQSMQDRISGKSTNISFSSNFVRIEGGTFTMGSPTNETGRYNDEIQHRVTVSSFYMGKYPVTQKEYQEIMVLKKIYDESYYKDPNLPVHGISWYEAVEYCNKRSQQEGLTPAYTIDKSRSDPNNTSGYDNVRWLVTWNRNANGYRLPTEAEWEYARRAGTTTPYNTGDIRPNYYDGYVIKPVGSYPPNPWGLYYITGRVGEWCWDWYGSYFVGSQMDPTGSTTGTERVIRHGGSTRSAHRFSFEPSGDGVAEGTFGFRVVRNAN